MLFLLPRYKYIGHPLFQVIAKRRSSSSLWLTLDQTFPTKGTKTFTDQTFSLKHWDLSTALVICRSPMVAPRMQEFETRLLNYSNTLEWEGSLKSDFELKQVKDIALMEKRRKLEKERKDLSEIDAEIGELCSEQIVEWEERRKELVEQYKLDNLEANEENADPQSLRRRFLHKLVLVVRQTEAASSFYGATKGVCEGGALASPFVCPELRNRGEPLRETADRCLANLFDADIPIKIWGNAPFAHYRRQYDRKTRSEYDEKRGAVIFFYLAQLDSSFLDRMKFKDGSVVDYRWCASDELKATVRGMPPYRVALQSVLEVP